MFQRHFRYADVVLDVQTSEAGDLAWLEEFLAPGFTAHEPGAAATPVARVELVVDAERADRLRDGAVSDGLRPCFALDTEIVRLPSWERDGQLVLFEQARGCLYVDGPDAFTLVATPDAPGRRLALMRVVRELAAQARRREPGRLPLHAAALSVDGQGVLLAGPKRAGKTTLLTHLLLGTGGQLISNDRVFVELDSAPVARPCVRGMPTAVSIRAGTLQRYPALLRGVPDCDGVSQTLLADMDALSGTLPPHPAEQRLRMSPALFCRQLGVAATSAAPLQVVLLGVIDPGVAGWQLQRLPPAVAAERLWDGRYGAAAGDERTRLDARLPGRVVDDLPATCRALAEVVPVFECRLGPDAYDAPDAARALLSAAR